MASCKAEMKQIHMRNLFIPNSKTLPQVDAEAEVKNGIVHVQVSARSSVKHIELFKGR